LKANKHNKTIKNVVRPKADCQIEDVGHHPDVEVGKSSCQMVEKIAYKRHCIVYVHVLKVKKYIETIMNDVRRLAGLHVEDGGH